MFLRKLLTDSHSGCTSFYSHQFAVSKGPLSPHPHQHWWFAFLMIAVLTKMKWSFKVGFTFHFPEGQRFWTLFKYLFDICIYRWETVYLICLFTFVPLLETFFFFYYSFFFFTNFTYQSQISSFPPPAPPAFPPPTHPHLSYKR